jgi:hypothetical protein
MEIWKSIAKNLRFSQALDVAFEEPTREVTFQSTKKTVRAKHPGRKVLKPNKGFQYFAFLCAFAALREKKFLDYEGFPLNPSPNQNRLSQRRQDAKF